MENGMPQNDMQQYEIQPEQNGGSGMAIAAMVVGIVSLVAVCVYVWAAVVLAIVGIVLAVMVMKQNRPGKGMAIAGLVCSIVTIVFCIIALILGAAVLAYIFS